MQRWSQRKLEFYSWTFRSNHEKAFTFVCVVFTSMEKTILTNHGLLLDVKRSCREKIQRIPPSTQSTPMRICHFSNSWKKPRRDVFFSQHFVTTFVCDTQKVLRRTQAWGLKAAIYRHLLARKEHLSAASPYLFLNVYLPCRKARSQVTTCDCLRAVWGWRMYRVSLDRLCRTAPNRHFRNV